MPPCPRPASSETRWRTSPSSSPLHRSRLRQSGTSCPGVQLLPPPGRRQHCLGLLVAEGGPLPPTPLPRSSLQPSSAVEPAVGQPPRPSRPPPNQAASVGASGPETDDPGMEMFALREMVNAKPSPRGQTFHSFGQECPWNRSPGTLWFTQMSPPRAGGPRSMGMQCRGFGRVPNCTGTSTG